MDTAALGVDADNPSGALGLYESSGFDVVNRGAAYADGRPLRLDRYGRNLAGKLAMMPLLNMSAIWSAWLWTLS